MQVTRVIRGRTVIVSPEHAFLLDAENWCWDADGYLKRTIYEKGYLYPETQYLHQIVHPPKSGYQVDHIDRNKANNTRENLRDLLPWQNKLNTGPRKSEFGFIGVTRHKKKYRAQAQLRVIGKFLRSIHNTPEDAAIARDLFMREHAPDVAYLNFPDRIHEYDWLIAVRWRWTLKAPYYIAQEWEKDIPEENWGFSKQKFIWELSGTADSNNAFSLHLARQFQFEFAEDSEVLRHQYYTTKDQLRAAVTRALNANLNRKTISVRTLAAELDISKSHIQRLTEPDSPVALETLLALARYFDIPYKFEHPARK